MSERTYRTYLLFGNGGRFLWCSEAWSRLVPRLDAILRTTSGRPAISSSQIDRRKRSHVRFGRLGWSSASHERWTHGSQESEAWFFEFTSLYVPSLRVCEREGRTPDLYFEISSTSGAGFDQVLLLALATDLSLPPDEAERKLIEAAAPEMRCVLGATCVRRFWYRRGSGFVRSMDYVTHEDLRQLREDPGVPTIARLNASCATSARRSDAAERSPIPEWELISPELETPSSHALSVPPEEAMSERVEALLWSARAGWTLEWTEHAGRPAVRVSHEDGGSRLSFLGEEEREQLRRALAADERRTEIK